MSNFTRRPSRAGAIGLATAALWLTQLFLFPHIAVGQMPRENVRIALAGRKDLDSLADVASKQAADPTRDEASRQRSSNTASAIRARLQEGDFRVGDRIIVYVRGDTSLSNTFSVREGVVLKLPNLPDIPLMGVLRSEVEAKVRDAVAHYLRDPDVRVGSLVRIGVTGQVVRPGYYQMAADMLLSDALMTAGGPTPLASSDKIIVRRGSQDLWDAENVREFMASGATLAQLDFHSGDEILVQEKTRRDWVTISQIVAAMSGAVLGFVYLTRKH
jgi:protein involved in polysaccharide export with SLBB domain